MQIYDTLSGEKKEVVQPRVLGLFKKPIKLFVCGPTVYDYPHIGNARTFVFFDMFVRYLRSRGYRITYLQNITNVDDKIIQRAQDEHTTWQEVSQRFEKIFRDDMARLGVCAVTTYAPTTDFIPQVVAQVQTLIDRGSVYKIDDDGWYFDLTTYPGYGELARRTIAQAEDGVSRVDNSDKKKNAGDFCVWKFSKPGEPVWESALGAGRPGWHIEDTATTEHFFGPQYDIHGGALDLKFPHHEAERALQESASGKKPFVRIWMHAGFLTVDGKKMSKSLGNFTTISDLLKEMTADEFRMLLLMHHYRKPLDFTKERIKLAQKSLLEIRELIWKLQQIQSRNHSDLMEKEFAKAQKEFTEFIDDDFDTYKAFGLAIGVLTTQIHKVISTISLDQARKLSDFLVKTFAAFGITLTPQKPPQPVSQEELPPEAQKLFEEYKLFRASKQFTQSDALRKQIEQLGYKVEDTPQGSILTRSH